MEDDSDLEQSSWANLPDVCLRHVFHWLDDKNRSQAALVCKRWNQALYSGSLWRTRTIIFNGQPSRAQASELETALWHVKKFGKYLERLEIKLLHPYSTVFTRKFQVSMRSLLSHLGKCNCRLVSLSIKHLELDRSVWRNIVRVQFIKNLGTFLKRMSKQLNYLNLKGARLTLEEGCELLNSLSCLTNTKFISEINIEDFFSLHLPVYSSTLFYRTVSKFHSLVILTLNYNCVSDELLDILSKNSAHSLSTLNIKCHIYDPHGQVVWGMSWANLARSAPKLSVNFYFERVMKHDRLSRILLAEIPVRSISLRSYCFRDPDWMMKPTLTTILPAYWHMLQHYKDLENHSKMGLYNLLSHKQEYYRTLQFGFSIFFSNNKRLIFAMSFNGLRLLHLSERDDCHSCTQVRIYTFQQETREEDRLLHSIYEKFKNLIDSELNYFVISYPLL
ncbi:hypothetical protein ASZ78_016512 [Callipepla squamata]|uniref:F-box domain-containing protein n=1 Tax=Callipepla squamata TaxID=9009 RepID=A0A226MWH4_CALSU|nr:hypothetical protein ASZ78_016512 [Callipepla squamata]